MSLHTAHRPTSWGDVVGQDHIVKSLQKAAKDKRAHTFLFSGPSGVGKTTLARILANEFAGGKASPANIYEIEAANYTGVDDMRRVLERAAMRAIGSSPVKSIILDEAHRLSGSAWDVLLKPTEEPPSHLYFMFCTTNLGKVPKAIVTRSLAFELKPVSEDKLLELLVNVSDVQGLTVSDDIIEAIVEESAGSPRQSLVFLEACCGCATVAEAKKLMRSAANSAEVIDLCRWLLQPRGGWNQAVTLVKKLNGAEPESARINIVNYLAQVLLNTKGDDKAKHILTVMEPFSEPFNTSDKMAPLLRAIALAIGMDQ